MNEKKSGTREFFANPIVGITGSIASVIGLVLAIYFFHASNRSRELTYLVHPARAVIVRAGQLSRLTAMIDGAPIKTDVTAAQIAFWNAGAEPIRAAHVLQEFNIATNPPVPIIDASLRKQSREVVNVRIDSSHAQQGKLNITWDILEHNDGAIVQVILAGNEETQLSANAIIEGQSSVRAVKVAGKKPSVYSGGNGGVKIAAICYAILGIFFGRLLWPLIPALRRQDIVQGKMGKVIIAVLAIFPGLCILFAAIGWFFLQKPTPPFGF